MVLDPFKPYPTILQEEMDDAAAAPSQLTDFNVGSDLRTTLEATALVLAELHFLSSSLLKRFWVMTATGQWLDKRGEEVGLSRILASPTTRLLTFGHAGGPAVAIPIGQQYRTPPGAPIQVTYQVIQAGTLAAGASSVSLSAISTTTGTATALPDATVLQPVGVALGGIDTVVTDTIAWPGTDLEPDGEPGVAEDFRGRILEKLQNPEGPGNQGDYVRWTKEASPLVKSVSVLPLESGFGTVTVLILGANNALPDGPTIAAVQNAIDPAPSGTGAGLAPIGAQVTVAAPATLAVDVAVSVTAGPGFDGPTVKAAVQAAIAAYLNGLGIGQTARIGAVADAAWRTPGVGGPRNLDGGAMNLPTMRVSPAGFAAADISASATQKIVAGTVTVS